MLCHAVHAVHAVSCCIVGKLCFWKIPAACMQALAAHVCYVLAGLHSQAYDDASQLCLVGADHRSQPRRFATLSAMQRNEVLEWAHCQGIYPMLY